MRSIDRAIRIATLSAGKFTKNQVDVLRETIKSLYIEEGEEAFFSISPIPIEGKENADVWVEGEDLQNGIGLALEETGQTHYSLSVVVSESTPAYTPPTVSGGDEYDVLRSDGRTWRVHEFKTSGELSVTDLGDDPMARVVLVGGGGSGGSNSGVVNATGGGGAGGSVEQEMIALTIGDFPITVGGGGAARGPGVAPGLPGSPTTGLGITALGGGYGGSISSGGPMPGGNGGGAGEVGTGRVGGAGVRKGGDSNWTHTDMFFNRSSAGGAGAGTAGGDSALGVGGDAGHGVQSDISGDLEWYGVGAPGGVRSSTEGNVLTPGAQAPGGAAAAEPGQPGNAGANGRGCGGSGSSVAMSGRGGDGIAYVSYPLEALS